MKRQYQRIQGEVSAAMGQVMAGGQFVLGENLRAFEEEFAAYCGASYAVGVASGTDALELALKALGIGPGDEVVTVSFTFVATVAAVLDNGAKPVLADIDPRIYNIDPSHLRRLINHRTKAILPVHLYGHPADVARLRQEAPGIPIVEDAAQAHGAQYKGRRVGSLGDIACFSFYPSKNLGAYGEGGAVVTDDVSLAEKVRSLRDHGRQGSHTHTVLGRNSRLHEIQAAILRVKLRYLEEWVQRRRQVAQMYSELLLGVSQVTLPQEMPWAKHAYHLFVVRCQDRDKLRDWLGEMGIATGIHYPIPTHLQPAFASLGYQQGSLPISESCAGEILSLPMFPELTREEVQRVAEGICTFYRR